MVCEMGWARHMTGDRPELDARGSDTEGEQTPNGQLGGERPAGEQPAAPGCAAGPGGRRGEPAAEKTRARLGAGARCRGGSYSCSVPVDGAREGSRTEAPGQQDGGQHDSDAP